MVLVAGSTGMVGGEICRILAHKGRKVRALVRAAASKDMVRSLEDLGVEIVRGDVRDAASLQRACKGAKTVISTVSSMPTRYQPGENDIASVDDRGIKNLVDAARGAGVEAFVLTSFSPDLDFPLRNAKREGERHLKSSGMTWTILRPSYFMEAWLSPMVGFDYEKRSVRVFGSGEKPVSYVSFRDVASIAAASLESEEARNAILSVGGPEALSPNEVVRIFEETAGATFSVERVPEAALAAQVREASDPMQKSFSGLMLAMAAGDAIEMGRLAARMGVSLKSVRQYAREVLPQTVRK